MREKRESLSVWHSWWLADTELGTVARRSLLPPGSQCCPSWLCELVYLRVYVSVGWRHVASVAATLFRYVALQETRGWQPAPRRLWCIMKALYVVLCLHRSV